MSSHTLDIVQLVEHNSLTRLNKTYESKLINRVKDTFKASEQQLFVSSFYCYLNYNQSSDFIIDFDTVWKWAGFTRKQEGKRLLTRHFTEDTDYKVEKGFAPIGAKPINTQTSTSETVEATIDEKLGFAQVGTKPNKGGRPEENILLTVNTFKKFLMKACTKKADEIHDYYIKLENLLHETMNEQANELLQQTEKLKKLQENHNRLVYKRNKHKLKKGECFYIIKNPDVSNRFKIGFNCCIYSLYKIVHSKK